MSFNVLVADDSQTQADAIARIVLMCIPDCKITFARSEADALRCVESDKPFEIALVDLNLTVKQEQEGLRVLASLRTQRPECYRMLYTFKTPAGKLNDARNVDDLISTANSDVNMGAVLCSKLDEARLKIESRRHAVHSA